MSSSCSLVPVAGAGAGAGAAPIVPAAIAAAPRRATSERDRLLEIGRKAIDEVGKAITSSCNIIPDTKIGKLTFSNIKEQYQKHGEKLLSWIEIQKKIAITRNVVWTILSSISGIQDLIAQGKDYVAREYSSIVCGRFGFGKCGELSIATSLRCNSAGLRTIVITLENEKEAPETRHYHAYVITGSASEVAKFESYDGETPFAVRRAACPGLVVVDSLVNVCCPIGELATKGKPLQDYIDYFGLNRIVNPLRFCDPDFAKKIEGSIITLVDIVKSALESENMTMNNMLNLPLPLLLKSSFLQTMDPSFKSEIVALFAVADRARAAHDQRRLVPPATPTAVAGAAGAVAGAGAAAGAGAGVGAGAGAAAAAGAISSASEGKEEAKG